MKPSKLWATTSSLVLVLAALAAGGGACSATGSHAASGSNGSGTSSASGAGGAGTTANAASSTGALGIGAGSGAGGSDAGPVGPPAVCDPTSCQAGGGACQGQVCVITENPGKVSAATQGSLQAGGMGDPSFSFRYPYDRTVFPRGLIPPTLQFGGAAPDAVYVHVSGPGIEYKGYFGASNPGRVVFSQAVWGAISLASTGAPGSIQVQVSKTSGGKVAGPLTETWTIATGSLKGTIYYETYDSPILGGFGSVGIMKIQPGATAPTAMKSGCGNVCHTASADGSTLVAAQAFGGLTSASYDLKNNASQIFLEQGDGFEYGGLYPNGSFLISSTNFRTWLSNPSRLYDTQTGKNVPTPSWDSVITNGGNPAFSPDGTMVVFNHEDTGNGLTLATMKYSAASKSFSALTDVASDPTRYLGWPAFTPDTRSVVYHAGSDPNFETDSGNTGDLFYVDLATKKAARLDAADGYANGKVYLPDDDPNLNFAPTVLPEAVGGYFWVVFTSHRAYGNTLPSMDNGDQNGKLWVAAFDLTPTPGQDPSHPAFFLDGQESASDNLRGFWVLNPCSATGTTCASGDDCCTGFCRSGDGGALQCVTPPAGGCSNEFESCTTAADCCDPGYECINSKCAQPTTK